LGARSIIPQDNGRKESRGNDHQKKIEMILLHNLNSASAILLIIAVGVVGVLHTMVPDHWVPITLLAKQRGWTRIQTARGALGAGTGHVLSTLALGLVVWWQV